MKLRFLILYFQTIFEVNSTAKNKAFNVMKKKRGFHQEVIHRVEVKREVETSTPTGGDTVPTQDTADENDLQVTNFDKLIEIT